MNHIKLLKNNDKRNLDDAEWIGEFIEFLLGNCPDSIHLPRGHQPKMSLKKAEAIVWYLQEHFPVLPDSVEFCHNCGNPYDSYGDGLYWETKGRHYCGSCMYPVPENYDRGKR